MKGVLSRAFNAYAPRGMKRARIFAQVARQVEQSLVARQALAWAEACNLHVYYDRALDGGKVAGIYRRKIETGETWIALPPEKFAVAPAEEKVNTLVHEIRHAWQDAQGFMSHAMLDAGDAIVHGMLPALQQLCLNEADAATYGTLAVWQIERADRDVREIQVLQAGYIDWFASEMGGYYDNFTADWQAFLLREAQRCDESRDYVAAMQRACTRAAEKPVPAYTDDVLIHMGEGFSGGNYQRENDFHAQVAQPLLRHICTEVFTARDDDRVDSIEDSLRRLRCHVGITR